MADIPFKMIPKTADEILTEAQYVAYEGTTTVKDKIESLESSVTNGCYKYKGSKASLSALKTSVTSGAVGDVYNVEDTDMNYAITGVSSQKAASFTIAGKTVTIGTNETTTLALTETDIDGETTYSGSPVCKLIQMESGSDADMTSVYCLYWTDTSSVDHLVLADGVTSIALKNAISYYDGSRLVEEGLVEGDYLVSDSITTKNVITWDALGGDTSGKLDKPASTVKSGKVLMSKGNGETEWAAVQMGMTDDDKADLEKLMLKTFPITASTSISPAVIEKGVSTAVTLTWSNVQVDGAAVESTATVNDTAATSPFKENISDSKTYSLVIASGSRTLTVSKSVAAYYPTWCGFADYANQTITPSNIAALMAALSSSKTLRANASFSVSVTNSTTGNAFCIITPYKLTKIEFMTVPILSDEFTPSTVTYNGATYYCYTGKALATGSFSFTMG